MKQATSAKKTDLILGRVRRLVDVVVDVVEKDKVNPRHLFLPVAVNLIHGLRKHIEEVCVGMWDVHFEFRLNNFGSLFFQHIVDLL